MSVCLNDVDAFKRLWLDINWFLSYSSLLKYLDCRGLKPYLISTDLKELMHLLKRFLIIVSNLLSAYSSVF